MGNLEIKFYQCSSCGDSVPETDFILGADVCGKCFEDGIWTDPAGGVHHGDEDDPAKMYE